MTCQLYLPPKITEPRVLVLVNTPLNQGVKLRDYIARQKAYAYVEHFNSSIHSAMSMFKLSVTSRWALMAARGWARLILDRRRDLINDRPSRAAAAEAPLDGAQERHHFDNPTNHSRGAFYHGEAA